MREQQICFYFFPPGDEPTAWCSMLRMCNTAHGALLLPGTAQKTVDKEGERIISSAATVPPAPTIYRVPALSVCSQLNPSSGTRPGTRANALVSSITSTLPAVMTRRVVRNSCARRCLAPARTASGWVQNASTRRADWPLNERERAQLRKFIL